MQSKIRKLREPILRAGTVRIRGPWCQPRSPRKVEKRKILHYGWFRASRIARPHSGPALPMPGATFSGTPLGAKCGTKSRWMWHRWLVDIAREKMETSFGTDPETWKHWLVDMPEKDRNVTMHRSRNMEALFPANGSIPSDRTRMAMMVRPCIEESTPRTRYRRSS